MANYLERYQAGDFSVWNEIVKSAPTIISDPELLAQARDVASAIMTRAKTNTTTLRKTLANAGAILAPIGEPLTDEDLSMFTKRFGAMPLSLEVFYKTVGSISLTPVNYDYGPNTIEDKYGIELLTLDPLQIEPANILNWALDEYDADFTEEEQEDNPFALYLCPDFLHKADISGGTPYSVYIPASTPENKLDPLVNFDDLPAMSFVEYLRYCFKWGGFAGLAVLELDDNDIDLNRQMPFEDVTGDWRAAARNLLQELRTGLIPF